MTYKLRWDKTVGKIVVVAIESICIGIAIAIVAKIYFIAGVVVVTQPVLLYIIYAVNAVALAGQT